MNDARIALILGIGTGIAFDPTLRQLIGSWAGILAAGLVVGAVLVWWRRPAP